MFHFATSELMHFLTVYGYWAVLFFVAVESMGIPLPGETMLLVAAIYAGTTHRLAIPLVIAAAERAFPGPLDAPEPVSPGSGRRGIPSP